MIVRPYYAMQYDTTPFAELDGGHYDGWTGGVLSITNPVSGSTITSKLEGDKICKIKFGDNSEFATFHQG